MLCICTVQMKVQIQDCNDEVITGIKGVWIGFMPAVSVLVLSQGPRQRPIGDHVISIVKRLKRSKQLIIDRGLHSSRHETHYNMKHVSHVTHTCTRITAQPLFHQVSQRQQGPSFLGFLTSQVTIFQRIDFNKRIMPQWLDNSVKIRYKSIKLCKGLQIFFPKHILD